MFGKQPPQHPTLTFVFLATALLVFVIGIALAPELLHIFAPACMVTLGVSYALLSWMERKDR